MYYLEVSKKIASYDFLQNNIKSVFKIPLNNYLNTLYIKNINDYLKKNYNLTLNDIYKLILKNLYISEQKDKNIIFIEDNIKIKDYRLKEILSLIEYGNREVKGIRLLSRVFDYLKRNLYYIHMYYVLNQAE